MPGASRQRGGCYETIISCGTGVSGLAVAGWFGQRRRYAAGRCPASLPPAPAPNWTGGYLGAIAGAAWTNNDSTLEAIGGSPPGIPLGPAAGSAAAYGGQVGCDYQANSKLGRRPAWGCGTQRLLKASIQGAVTAGGNTITSALKLRN